MSEKTTFKDVLNFLTELHDNIKSELDNTSLDETAKINNLALRLNRIMNAKIVVESERDYYERGSCLVCGKLIFDTIKGKPHCEFHRMES
jgi:hypothetical protein